MSIQEEIHVHLRNAILTSNGEVKSLLRVVIGEMNRQGKVLTNDQVISIIKKMIENAKIIGNQKEIAILETYLPQQLSEDELGGLISALIYANNYGVKDMGKIMTALKEKYAGRYDGKLASTLAKDLLTKEKN